MSRPRLDTIAARDHRVLVVVAQRDVIVLALEVGEAEAADPADRLERGVERPRQLLGERREVGARSGRGRSRRPSR